MRTQLMLLPTLGLLLGCGGGADRLDDRQTGAAAGQPGADTSAPAATAMTDTAGGDGLEWGPAPPGLPPGARVAVISGDPSKAGPFTVQVEMPTDYTILPHHHPTSEELRLLEGTLHLGHGTKWVKEGMKTMATDQPVRLEAKEPHYLHAASPVVMEVQSTGPFAITYIDPKDDPRAGSTP